MTVRPRRDLRKTRDLTGGVLVELESTEKRDAFLNTSVSQIAKYNFNSFGSEFNDFNPVLGQQQTELGLLAGNAKAVFRDLALQLMK